MDDELNPDLNQRPLHLLVVIHMMNIFYEIKKFNTWYCHRKLKNKMANVGMRLSRKRVHT